MQAPDCNKQPSPVSFFDRGDRLPCYDKNVLLIPCLSTVCSEGVAPRARRWTRPGDHTIPNASVAPSNDHSRRVSQRSPSPHRADAARPVGEHRRVARARLPPRTARARMALPISSSTCCSRAPQRAAPKTSPRRSTLSAGRWTRFTAKEYASYYIKVLDEHLPLAVDVLSDIVMRPRFSAEDIEREKKVVTEEIKMVEDTRMTSSMSSSPRISGRKPSLGTAHTRHEGHR